MEYIVNINEHNKQVELIAGGYKIDVLGGFGVEMGQFEIKFKHIPSEQVFTSTRVRWPIQGYKFNKRSKRILSVELDLSGLYEIQFIKPETLGLRESNAFLFSWFNETVPNKVISVYIHPD